MSRIRLAGFSAAVGILFANAAFNVSVPSAAERSVRAASGDPPTKSTAQVGVGVNKYVRHEGRGCGGKQRATRNPGPGWSHAQVQRMARKRRNVLRNRRAHR